MAHRRVKSVAGICHRFDAHPNDTSVRLGESWNHGAVVLAWDSVKRGAINFRDGHNVAMHEFAHQLDQEDGRADGAPILEVRSAYSAWSQVFSKEYELLQHKAKKGKKSVMHSTGPLIQPNSLLWQRKPFLKNRCS